VLTTSEPTDEPEAGEWAVKESNLQP
jgi:hypothetical protein